MKWTILLTGRLYLPIFLFVVSSIALGCKSNKMLADSSKSKSNSVGSGTLKKRYAAILNVSEREISNEKLYQFIDSWMGTPHVDGGMTKSGVDCSGFTLLLQKEVFNKNLPRVARQMAEQVKQKDEKQLKEGDLVFFNFKGKKFSHVGVYLQNNKFVHVSTSRGVVVSNLKDPWYYQDFSKAGSVN